MGTFLCRLMAAILIEAYSFYHHLATIYDSTKYTFKSLFNKKRVIFSLFQLMIESFHRIFILKTEAKTPHLKSLFVIQLQNSKKSKAHQIVPEIAHLIESNDTETNVTDFGSHRLMLFQKDAELLHFLSMPICPTRILILSGYFADFALNLKNLLNFVEYNLFMLKLS